MPGRCRLDGSLRQIQGLKPVCQEAVLCGAGRELGQGCGSLGEHRGEGLMGGCQGVRGRDAGRGGIVVDQSEGQAQGRQVVAQHPMLPGSRSQALPGFFGFADE